MSDSDVDEWKKKKELYDNNVDVWVPPYSDMEHLFCEDAHIASVMEILLECSREIIGAAIQKIDPEFIEREFNNALDGAIKELPSEDRSIVSARWRDLGGVGIKTIKGKVLMPKIREAIQDRFKEGPERMKLGRLSSLSTPSRGIVIAADLKAALEKALNLGLK
jgi:hypothetical protein